MGKPLRTFDAVSIRLIALFYMVSLEVNDAVVLEQKQVLEQALSTNPKTQKALQKLIRKVIAQARIDTMKAIKFNNGDPREAVRSIRRSVYKKILGANINIYDSKRAHGATTYEPPRHPSRRGGNRIKIDTNSRSYKIAHYAPQDRGMILRWVNSGTQKRQAFGGRMSRRGYDSSLGGNRGSISARNFFRNTGEPALIKAVDALANLIDTELEAMLNKKK